MLRALCICTLLCTACDDEHCAEEQSASDGAPSIEDFELIGQLDGDPWTLIFASSFSDSDGDLAAGAAELHLNGERSGSSVELFDVFRSSGVPATAQTGRIAFPLRFSDSVQDDAEVWLGLQFLDARQQRSNCAALQLHFDVR